MGIIYYLSNSNSLQSSFSSSTNTPQKLQNISSKSSANFPTMSQQHPSTNRANPDDQTQENRGGVEEGYETPTSEEHKIPPVCLSCPPPAPKKRKRIFMDRRIRIGKVVLCGKIVEEKEFESFFCVLQSQSQPQPQPQPQSQSQSQSQSLPPPLPVSEPELDQGTSPKMIRSDK